MNQQISQFSLIGISKWVWCLLLVSFVSTSVLSQTSKYPVPKPIINPIKTDWSFVTQMGNIHYIDFQEAPFEIEEIQVLSTNNQLLFNDQVSDLPEDTFYELNLQERRRGYYVLYIKGKRQSLTKLFYLKGNGS